ncbi:MAG: redoxin domain-containing protein [Nitrosopumilus sp.]|nr:redoxin domain-containing protein [Nitrosopumilus sp.]
MNENEFAPNFELTANDGSKIDLESLRNKKNVVLCFYHKNRLFACPSKMVFKMAASVISAYPKITSTDSVLFAISGDNVNDQEKFVNEYGIPYLHLSDPSKETCKKYAGLNFVGLPKRSTFVIDKSGMIRKIFRNIDVEKHGQEIASFLENLH